MNKFTKTLNIMALSLMPVLTMAAPAVQFGRVVEIKGSAFISYEGQTHEIKKGEVINANSELIVESSGQVTFTDNADHRFFLGNSSTAAVYPGKVELRSGDIWMQSLNKMDDHKLVSANAEVSYQGGEAILSYDSVKGKTQLMVINGLMKFSNLKSPELNLTVSEGNFSFVDPGYEEGMPRDPTPVGEKSYKAMVSIFPGVAPMDKHSVEIFKDKPAGDTHGSRGIASVPEVSEGHGAKSEVKAEAGHRAAHTAATPVKKEAHELEKEYKNEVMKLKKESYTADATPKAVKKTAAKKEKAAAQKLVVNIYGLNGAETSATTEIYDIPVKESIASTVTSAKGRGPASVATTDTVLDQAVPKTENMNTNPSTPQYKESEKLLEQLNKL